MQISRLDNGTQMILGIYCVLFVIDLENVSIFVNDPQHWLAIT